MSDESRISVTCSNCEKRFKVKSIAAGRRVPCPGCKSPIQVPLATQDDWANDLQLKEPPPVKLTENDAASFLESGPKIEVDLPSFSFPQLENGPPSPPSAKPYSPPQSQPTQPAKTHHDRKTFPMLRMVMMGYRIMAGLIGVSWLTSTIIIAGMWMTGSLATASEPEAGGVAIAGAFVAMLVWIATTVSHVIVILLLLTMAEAVELGLRIEKNTFDAAHNQR